MKDKYFAILACRTAPKLSVICLFVATLVLTKVMVYLGKSQPVLTVSLNSNNQSNLLSKHSDISGINDC